MLLRGRRLHEEDREEVRGDPEQAHRPMYVYVYIIVTVYMYI